MGYRPSKNTITGEFSSSHPGHDFSGKGDDGVYAYEAGVVVISRDKYTTSWINGKENDPTPWGLTTEDYGNFIKIKHTTGFSLYAHLAHGTPLPVNSTVVKGQRIATVGNTGNSTGRHLHFEVRNLSEKTIQPSYETPTMTDTIPVNKQTFENLVKASTELDAIKATGIKSVTDIEDLKRMTKESQNERNTAVEEAKNTREEFSNYKAKIAEKLQSPQDLSRVLSAIDDTMKKLEQATSNGQNDASENQKYEAQIVELQAELSRLKLLIQAQNPLDYATASDLLHALLKKLSVILKRG